MIARALTAFVAVAVIGNELLFAQQESALNAGDHVVLAMTGELAVEYSRVLGFVKQNQIPSGLAVEMAATIAKRLDDGDVLIEHTTPILRNCDPARLVTFTVKVDSAKLTKSRRIELSELKGVKLRSWTLAEEIGD